LSSAGDDDKRFERVLASFLREDTGGSRTACPQPGILSTFFEGKLSEHEARELEVHLSQCGACQAEVATLVRLQLDLAVETGRPEPIEAPPVIITSTRPSSEPEKIVPSEEPAVEAPDSQARPRHAPRTWIGPVALAASAVLAIFVTYRFAPFWRRPTASKPRASTEEVVAASEKVEPGPKAVTSAPVPRAASAPSAEQDERIEAMQARKDEQPLQPRPADREAAMPAPATSPELAAASSGAPEGAGGGAVVVVARSNPNIAWRARDASIERSEDGGKTWRTQLTGEAPGVLTGSAPTPTICWLAGRNGLVLRTSDGDHWKRLVPPTTADLTLIEARTDSSATVQTAGGERFSTLDGGASWSKL
jgi:hypothetical protein